MSNTRVGRFEINYWTDGLTAYTEMVVDLYADHANGQPREYKITHITEEELRDLHYLCERTIRLIVERKAAFARGKST